MFVRDPRGRQSSLSSLWSLWSLCLLAFFATAGLAPSPTPRQQSLHRIAFGSCAEQNRPQPIWSAIVAGRPDLFLFLGDTVYCETENMDELRAAYTRLATVPGFKALKRQCPILATTSPHVSASPR